VTLPTGDRIDLRLGDAEATVGTVAAVLRSLRVGGVALTEEVPDDARPPFCTGIILSPWPNRVRDARWVLDGVVQQLDLTEPARGNALHGLLEFTEYEVRERSESAVTLGAVVYPQHGWPFLLDTWVRYEVVPDGLAVTHGVENRSDRPAPYATGSHPFLRMGDTPVDDLVLTVPAASYVDVDERLNPIATRPVDGTRFDVRAGAAIRDLDLDTAYAGLVPDGDASAWLDAPDGARLTLWQDADWRYVQVFTTREYPAAGGLRTAVAVEPMTAPPDALNSGEGLVRLEPGETWEGRWGLRYHGGDEGE